MESSESGKEKRETRKEGTEKTTKTTDKRKQEAYERATKKYVCFFNSMKHFNLLASIC